MDPAMSGRVADAAPSEPAKAASDAEFVAIEAALSATDRGRRFLAEFARRRRAEESARILAAIDLVESRTLRGEIDRLRERLEAERVADVARQLGEVLKELRPVAEARARKREMEKHDPAASVTPLERRFAALVQLDGQDLKAGLKQFG